MKIVDVFKYKVMKMLHEQAEVVTSDGRHPMEYEDFRKHTFEDTSHYPIIANISNTHRLHMADGSKAIDYVTNDHSSQEAVHQSRILKLGPTQDIPFNHHEQSIATKSPESNLPKNYVQDLMFRHFEHFGVPLKSSDLQFPGGVKLWKTLSQKALDSGYHVYFHDHGIFNKLNKHTLEQGLEDYKTSEGDATGRRKHIIISKTPLNET